MAWAVPLYSRRQTNRAGEALVNVDATAQEIATALPIINNWRASHSYPLRMIYQGLRTRASAIDRDAIVAQRLKRLPSIADKLKRMPTMTLTQMQDIGGCRAIVDNIDALYQLRDGYLRTGGKFPHVTHALDDYINTPKVTGYRGIHLVYKYRSRTKPEFNDLRIEIQLRSVLQHRWATAVETIDAFTGQALKVHHGEDQWHRLFALMGSAIAFQENTAPVPGTPTRIGDLADELEQSANSLQLEATLQTYGTAIDIAEAGADANNQYFLLHVDAGQKSVHVRGFGPNELEQASAAYAETESAITGNPAAQVVLVSVGSLAMLRNAYPNYYLQTNAFMNLVRYSLVGLRHPSHADVEWKPPATASPASDSSPKQSS